MSKMGNTPTAHAEITFTSGPGRIQAPSRSSLLASLSSHIEHNMFYPAKTIACRLGNGKRMGLSAQESPVSGVYFHLSSGVLPWGMRCFFSKGKAYQHDH